MKKMIGFIIFWIAFGMAIMFFVNKTFFTACIVILLFVLGYNMFMCK